MTGGNSPARLASAPGGHGGEREIHPHPGPAAFRVALNSGLPERERGQFTHLQVYSHLTLLGGTASVADLAGRAAAEGMTHLALTDTNALYGAVAFDRACRAAGVKPILGMTATVAIPGESLGAATIPGRLVLLATGPAGYRSLCRLSSLIQARPEREALAAQGLTWEDLEVHSEGLLCLSGGHMGWIERYLRAEDCEAAARYTAHLAQIYGNRAYVSLELHQAGDLPIAGEMIALGQRFGLRPVAVQPVYCLSPDDAPRLRLLAAIDHNCPLDAVPAEALPAGGDRAVGLHWLSREEVLARFADLPEAVANVQEIITRCGPALPDGKPIWPALKLPEDQSPDRALTELTQAGLAERYQPLTATAQERLQAELDAIARRGYAPLFLVVADIARFARQAGVPINTRGSVANSLVAYCAGITHVDPITHDLLFERFLNPARADLPDIDLDFCSRRRDQVLDYVRRTYGPDHVALVSTVSTLRPLSAVRETAKAYGLDEAQIRTVAALLPHHWHPDPRRRDQRTEEEILASIHDAQLRKVVEEAFHLVEQPHHLSVHPGGVVITPGLLTDVVPVQWAPKGFLITQFDHRDVEAIGLPKLDLLGVRALTILADAAALVRQHHDPAFRLEQIPAGDPLTGDLLARAETIGVFQCESDGARRTLLQLRARTVKDLAMANAFFKPGPATGGMARTFVRRYRGEEPVGFLHPALEPILRPTQGVLIFQEQILRIARDVAGLSWEQADHLRRGMSHFGYGEMQQMQTSFVAGCRRPPPDGPGLTTQQAETLWEQVLAFAGYGFNQGHATSYADVSYRCAYLKTHWAAAFLCARLANYGGFHHPAIYMAEAVRLGLAVRPPHVNHSSARFTLDWEGNQGVLWMGLGQVRDLRQASVRAIGSERRRQSFAGVRDLAERAPLQHKELIHLIQCGALDGLGASRAAMLAEAAEAKRAGSALQMAFDLGRWEVDPESPAQRLAWEGHLLGQPVSVHPVELVAEHLPEHLPLRRLPEWAGRQVAAVGVRLPGWTGGQGFFLGDGDTFVTVKGERATKAPPPWQPLLVRGQWLVDEWGNSWLKAEQMIPVTLPQTGNPFG
ncbi:MAG: DNA polymerase III subunit alpha [Anaerolineae bacterium]|nr:DNA polymerase III subunit alpha [Anaerolineae bacterium]